MTKIIILAAGKGTRMKIELPKVLVTLFDKPLIRFVLESVEKSAIWPPMVVVGHQADLVKAIIGDDVEYIFQAKQLGTGHAVGCCKTKLADCHNVIVLNGDMPFVASDTINKIKHLHEKSRAVLTMATTVVPDFKDWRMSQYDYGRIIRNARGKIIGIKEFRDATDEEKEIKELNPSFFCFKADWLWENLPKLKAVNAKNEYYLTDLVKMAFEQKQPINTLYVNPLESVGVNTQEHLKLAESLLSTRIIR